jgi:hypothetical protein
MAVCSQCNGETPDGTTFCVNCGNKMPASAGAQSTQFGMPLLRPAAAPASERAGGPATTQFGPDEIAALALAAQEAGLEESEPLKPSLMAGLPRPPVSSAPSPLTASTGLKAPITPKPMPAFSPKPAPAPGTGSPTAPAARRTVMGMPLMGASAPPMAEEPELPTAPAPTAPATGGPIELGGASAILSMDSLVNDLLNAPPVSAPAASGPTASAASGPTAPTPEPAFAPTQTAPVAPAQAQAVTAGSAPSAGATISKPITEPKPAVRVRRDALPTQDTAPTDVDVPRTNTADLQVPTKSMWPVVIGVVVLVAAVAAFFLLRG